MRGMLNSAKSTRPLRLQPICVRSSSAALDTLLQ
jgi:hypothetical protein